MTKQEFIKAVAQAVRTAHPDRDLSAVMVENVLDALGDVAAAELLGGGEIPLPGLGKLKSKVFAARTGRNPLPGEPVDFPAHKALTFTACMDLKEALKPKKRNRPPTSKGGAVARRWCAGPDEQP